MRLAAFCLCALSCTGQIRVPEVGLARFTDGSVRRVVGVSGNLATSEFILSGAIRVSSSGRLSIAKLPDAVVVLDGDGKVTARFDAPAGDAVIGFDRRGGEALVYLPSFSSLVRCTSTNCLPVDVQLPGAPSALALVGHGDAVLAIGTGIVRMRLSDGATVDQHEFGSPVSLLSPSGTPIELPEGAEADWMGPDWAAVRTADGRQFGVRTSTGEMSVLSADAAFTLVLYDNGTETPVGAFIDLGSYPAGESHEFRFQVKNDTSASITLSKPPTVAGEGFVVTNFPVIPYEIAPGQRVEVRVKFTPEDAKAYSAILRINSTEVILRAVGVAGPTVSVEFDGVASVVASGSPIDFGRILKTSTAVRHIRISNGTDKPMKMNVARSGDGFVLKNAPQSPFDIPPYQSIVFDVSFEPHGSGQYSGTLSVNERQFKLAAVAYEPPLPRPIVDAGEPSLSSAKQQKLVIRLSDVAHSSGNGTLKMEFRPAAGSATDDSAVRFLSGASRIQSFQVAENDTNASFPGGKEILFQTGTTAGDLVFTAVLGGYSEKFTFAVAAASVAVDSVTAVRGTGQITVTITGFDNSRTAGPLAFTFYDTSGKLMGGEIGADASAKFKSFFDASPTTGGIFLLHAEFPVTGDLSSIGSVSVKVANSVGTASADRVTIK